MKSGKRTILISVLTVCLALLALSALCIGNYSISPTDLFTYVAQKAAGLPYDRGLEAVIVNIRLVRILSAIIIGAALSVSGAVYQTVFSNKMVSPDLLGVSSAAACGAAAAIVCGFPSEMSFITSFAFSVAAIFLSGLVSKLLNRHENLLMAGIIVAGFAKSGLGLLKYFADSENGELESIVYWELGSLAKVSWEQVAIIAPLIIGIIAVLFLIRRRLTCLAFGESASLLGIHVSLERLVAIALASLLVSLSTAICGIISWVSLIIPIASSELTRSGSLSDNLTITALLGAVFLLISDTVARASTTSEIPLSIMTGTAGLIVFCIAVFSKKREA
jgi:iron complex transport system permease protein